MLAIVLQGKKMHGFLSWINHIIKNLIYHHQQETMKETVSVQEIGIEKPLLLQLSIRELFITLYINPLPEVQLVQ